ncbi:MAG: peptide chain release factor 2 [Candidatus Omnitrophica bacterium]|nr:peptide chain release factor 2 [Candidatus Omnitrophota bacterium]
MLEDIKSKLENIRIRLEQLRGYLDVDNRNKLIQELNNSMSEQGFWDAAEKSTKVVKQLKLLKSITEPWQQAFAKYKELEELCAILKPQDQELLRDSLNGLALLDAELERLEFKVLLGGKFDSNSAILSINAGAGGPESCAWVEMLLRMYQHWADIHGFSVKTLDVLFGEEAGIKNVTILIEGEYAYGYLKAERGVHRLVRISPFDANKRRHTSFASVDVIPEIEEDVDIKLDEKDLRVDVYRSKGAGGQSVNTTDSAVRITHIPTGIVAQCQNERSQHQNKDTALKILKARIYELEALKKEEELSKQYDGDKKKIEWGSQIRSYVLHPYNLVKDHRTGYETGDANRVLNGKMDDFIEVYLKSQANKAAKG